MPGKNAVGAGSAYRQGATQQMPHAFAQGTVPGSVIDGQVDIDFRDFNIAHDSVPGEVENGIIFFRRRLQGFLGISSLCCGSGKKRLVICSRLFPLLHQYTVVCLGDDFLVGGEYL